LSFFGSTYIEGVTIKASEPALDKKNDSIRVLMDAQTVSFDEAPFTENGTMLVQFRRKRG
jgi:hypothetical protein